jgi:uncharacterized membrane protein
MNNPKDHSNNSNIFEILDGIMFQLSRTKKMFLIMILTTLIIPPVVLLVTTTLFDSPFQDRFEERFEKRLEDQLQRRLQMGDISPEEYQKMKNTILERGPRNFLLQGPQLLIFIISLGWLGVGIRQWIVLSKWDKRYQEFKKKQEDIDKKLDEDFSDEDEKEEK